MWVLSPGLMAAAPYWNPRKAHVQKQFGARGITETKQYRNPFWNFSSRFYSWVVNHFVWQIGLSQWPRWKRQMVLNAAPVCLLTLCWLSCPVPRAQRDAQATREGCAARAGLWGLNRAFTETRSLSFAFAPCASQIYTKPEAWETTLGRAEGWRKGAGET